VSFRQPFSAPQPASVEWLADSRKLRLGGSWTTLALGGISSTLRDLVLPSGGLSVDAGGLAGLDTAGALVLWRLLQDLREQGREVDLTGLDEPRAALLRLVETRSGEGPPAPVPRARGLLPGLQRIGRAASSAGADLYAMLAFVGLTFTTLLERLGRPRHLRGREILAVIQNDGVRAMPVLGMLSFLLGVVIAYQSGVQLRLYGGNLYVVDLVTITVLRELGPLMTAIVVAGRSGSAYTAQIGTMQVTEEVDALRSIGVSPLELLVLPKVLGLLLALPLLAMFANVMSVFGGMVMAAAMLDVEMATFLRRIPEAVTINSLLTGMGKAPVFALVVAGVGCYQGFQVRGGAESVGRRTTASVVLAIVLVIVVDAAFSVAYSALGI
jgi:phospholipid/cholesterol/gamma-HCH transport system permease protein